MSKKKTLSELEWQIMNVIWDSNNISVREVNEKLGKARAYTTIQTYLERLVDKGYLIKNKTKSINFYSSLVDKEKTRKNAVGSFLKSVFNNSFSKMAANLFDSSELTKDDLRELKKMIDDKIK